MQAVNQKVPPAACMQAGAVNCVSCDLTVPLSYVRCVPVVWYHFSYWKYLPTPPIGTLCLSAKV